MTERHGAAVPMLLALAVFGVLAWCVARGDAIFFDRPLRHWLHGHANAVLDRAMLAATWLGSAWVVAPAVLLMAYRFRRRPRVAAFCVLANGGAALLNVAAKHGFARDRPHDWTPLVHEASYSFPSGHAMQSMALVMTWLAIRSGRRDAGWPVAAAFAYPAIVGLSRVYLGVHYPSDVLAGWCGAIFWLTALTLALPWQGRHAGRWPTGS